MDLGRYRVVRPLGKGGMAEVLEAVAVGAEGFERRVAIKRLLPGHEQDTGFTGMFLDEARIASRLHHANIVSVLDYGVVDGQPFQVLELVDGLDAGRLWARGVERGQPLPLPLALHLGTTIAHALHHAHRARDAQGQPLGIVHRDVSPGNILVSWDGDVLLADFGIAFAKHRSERTRTGVAKGTVAYWAPEQATGGMIDARTDVFALAATVHRLIAGRSPLAGENALADLLVGRPLPLDPTLPADVAQVLSRALRRDRAERYADAAELAGALGACMSQRLHEDPRSALRRWLQTLRDEPAAAPGRLDALLGLDLEWVVVGEDDGVRTFAAHGAGGTAVAGPLGVATTMVASGQVPKAPSGSTLVVDPSASADRSSVVRRSSWREIWWLGSIAVLLLGGGLGVWWWSQSQQGGEEQVGVIARPRSPSVPPGGLAVEPERSEPAVEPGPPVELAADSTTGAPSPSSDRSDSGAEPSEAPSSERPRSSRRSTTKPGTGRSSPRGARPRAPDPAGTGFLLIGGAGALRAEIVVDGRRYGHAPRKIELSAGRHRVVLRDDSGAVVASRDVELSPIHTRSSPLRWVLPG